MMPNKWNEAPGIVHFKKKLGLTNFVPPVEQSWGFNKSDSGLFGSDAPIVSAPSFHLDWTKWECFLPVRNEEDDHLSFWAVRGTLNVLFDLLDLFMFEHETDWPKPQLIKIGSIGAERDFGGAFIGATLTLEMMKYFGKFPDRAPFQNVVDAMYCAYKHMCPPRGDGLGLLCSPREFRVYFHKPKFFHLNVPGDACGLDPNHNTNQSLDVGYDVSPHNVDNSFQQLTLLVGLAKLNALALQALELSAD